MGVATVGVLYLRTSPIYLLMLAVITFVLFLLVWAMLLKSASRSPDLRCVEIDVTEGWMVDPNTTAYLLIAIVVGVVVLEEVLRKFGVGIKRTKR